MGEVQMEIRTVVNIKEDAVKTPPRRLRVEPVIATRQREEVTFDKPAP